MRGLVTKSLLRAKQQNKKLKAENAALKLLLNAAGTWSHAFNSQGKKVKVFIPNK